MKPSPFWMAGAAVTLLATPAALVAQADTVQDLLKEFPTRQSAIFTELRKQKPDTPEYKKAVEGYTTYLKEFGQKAIAAVKANPKSPSALDLLTLILRTNPALSDTVLELVRANYVTDPKVGSLCGMLAYNETPAAEAVLKEIAAKNPDAATKAQATHTLGRRILTRFGVYAEKPIPEAEQAASIKQAEGYFNAVIKMFAANPKHAMAERARKDLTALANVLKLQIGKTAPEIEGEDIDGVKFKLSDYRGRVIMLDFWGNW